MRASACKHVLGLPENSCTAKCPAVLFRPWRSDSLCFTHTDPPPALQSRAALQSVLPRVREKKTQKHTSVSISKARTIIQATRTLSAQPRFETQLASCAQCSCVCMLHVYCRQAQHIVCCRVAKQKSIIWFCKDHEYCFHHCQKKQSQQYVYICKLHRNRVVVFADSMRAFSPWMFCDTWCFLSIWNISHCLMEIAMCMCTHRVFVSQSKRTRVSHCYCTVVFIIACSRGSCPV